MLDESSSVNTRKYNKSNTLVFIYLGHCLWLIEKEVFQTKYQPYKVLYIWAWNQTIFWKFWMVGILILTIDILDWHIDLTDKTFWWTSTNDYIPPNILVKVSKSKMSNMRGRFWILSNECSKIGLESYHKGFQDNLYSSGYMISIHTTYDRTLNKKYENGEWPIFDFENRKIVPYSETAHASLQWQMPTSELIIQRN
jgi:hypothetical protein